MGDGKWNKASIKGAMKDADSKLGLYHSRRTNPPPSRSHYPPIHLSTMATQVNLMTSDNQQFTVDKAVAQRSVLIKNMLEGKSYSHELAHSGR